MPCTQGMFQNFSLAYATYATYATYQVQRYTFSAFFQLFCLKYQVINHVGRTGQHVVVSPVF